MESVIHRGLPHAAEISGLARHQPANRSFRILIREEAL
jgi:hypothetical protein